MAWFQLVTGLLIVVTWLVLLSTGGVPEVAEGQRDIWFHLAAELLTATLLVVAGSLSLLGRARQRTALISMLALGALLYTAINSSGYYADRGEWAPVGMFGALALVTVIAALALLRQRT